MNPKKVLRIHVRTVSFGLILALLPLLTGPELNAQSGSTETPVRIRGKVVSLMGPELVVVNPSGDIKVNVMDKTIVRGEVPIKFSDITSGMYLGATATRQPDGNFLASEVHVFSEDQRGTGEGHYPLSSASNSGAMMTNGNVERVEDVAVQNVKGRLMTVEYKGGEVKIIVPPDIPVIKRIVGNRSLVKPGAELSIRAKRGSDGSLTASQITVRGKGK